VSTGILPRGVGASVERRLTPEPERPLPTDPVRWVREELDEFTWSHQQNVMRSVVAAPRTAWQACHGPGKSFTAARLGAWWLMAHPVGEAFLVTSAPSGHQVRTILWREIRRAHARGGLPGSITDAQVPEWKIDGEVVGFGRKPQDFVSPEQAMTQFQGIHARYLLVILDEACGVPEWLWNAATSLMTNESARILAIGNPDDPTTHFAKVCAPGSGWATFETSIFDTPNFTGEHVPEQLREDLPGPTYVENAERDWGVDSPLYIAKVLGQFPDVADDVVVTPKMIREAHERNLPGLGKGRFGMDVARFGADETCIYRNRDGVIRLVEAWRKTDTDRSRAKAQALLDEPRYRYVPMSVDVVGLGAGVYDPLRNRGYRVEPFNGGEAANDAARFVNRRTEAWWGFREGLEAGLIDLDPDDELLAAQLQQPKWRLDASAKRVRLETKDEMAKRGLKSPDRADAAIQSWYEGTKTVDDPTALLPGKGEVASITGDLLGRLT
jgi:hypothetical protein